MCGGQPRAAQRRKRKIREDEAEPHRSDDSARRARAITGAADFYLDYASPGIPTRALKEPVPSVAPAGPK
jgi:hypothetical protein